MKKLFVTIVVLSASAIAFFIIKPTLQNDYDGEITIIVVDQIGDIVSNQEISFVESDTLFQLLDDNYDIACANNQYQISDTCEKLLFSSRVVLKIDEVETNWLDNYIGIYIDDVYSTQGIDEIPLRDGATYRFEYTEVGKIE